MSSYDALHDYLSSLVSCYAKYKVMKRYLWNYEGQMKDPYRGPHAINVPAWFIDRIFPLDAALLDRMEEAFCFDFKQVKIHTGIKADSLTGELGARAVTMGNDIYFAAGAYDPYTEEGQKLMAHELVHVKQFSGGNAPLTGEDRDRLEGEAYRLEKIIGDSFHNLEPGALDNPLKSAFAQQGIGGGLNREAGGEGPDLLDDFTGENREKDREIIMENSGRVYRLSSVEVEEAKKEAINAFKDDLEQRIHIADREEKIILIEKLKAGGYAL